MNELIINASQTPGIVTFKNHVEEGYLLARELDNYVGMLKRS